MPGSDATVRPRLVWLANVASPYRRPLWSELARLVRLVVVLLEDDSRMVKDGRRGDDWAGAVADGYRLSRARTARLVRGEEVYYALLPARRPRLRGADAVVLGGWESPAFWQALIDAKLRNLATIGFYESTAATNRFTSGPVAWARARFFRSLDAVVVPGAAAARLLATFGVPDDRVHVGFNAVDVRAFAHAAAIERSTESSATGTGHRFVYVGQLIERKNVAGLLRAFAAVRQPGDHLTLIGSGDQEGRLRELALSLGLDDSTDFAGALPNDRLAAAMAAEHTLVLPSLREVWGLVVNEALACGLSVVVADSAGVAESVADMAGVVVVATDDRALADGMRRAREQWDGPIDDPAILDHDPAAFAEVFAEAVGSALRRRRRIG